MKQYCSQDNGHIHHPRTHAHPCSAPLQILLSLNNALPIKHPSLISIDQFTFSVNVDLYSPLSLSPFSQCYKSNPQPHVLPLRYALALTSTLI